MNSYLLGIDLGTESARSGIFDLKGNIIGIGSSSYQTFYEHAGWAEQLVEDWRKSLIDSIKEAVKNAGINAKDIIGIGLDATCCTPVFFDENNNPTRNPILWMDMRSSEEARFIESIDDPARRYNGYSKVSAEWFPCKVLWVKKNQPDVYKRSKIIAECTDWITWELTGNWTLGINTVTVRGYYDNRNGGFPKDFYNKIGLKDLFEKLPPKVLKLGEIAGYLRKEIAEQTGLKEGIPIAQGGADAQISVIGLNALKPKQLAYITGSSHLLLGTTDREFHCKGLFGTYPDPIIDNTFQIEGGQTSTGSVLKWFKENFISRVIEEEANKKNMSLYEYMDSMAAQIPCGSEGVIILEH
ncbi:MAG: xylulose kinase, partial [Actinobacteria bacterium]|nr:xylulose kinase [Actinomycetota bacterium]